MIHWMVMLVLLGFVGCTTVRPANQKRGTIEGSAGRTLPVYGISIDANYDQRLDDLIPGYKLLPVIMRNASLRAIPMDDKKDRWVIVGERGQRYTAVNSLRVKDPVRWRDIPEKMRTMIDYPEILPINYNVTFDLLLPAGANLNYFKEIRYTNAAWRQLFVIEKEY